MTTRERTKAPGKGSSLAYLLIILSIGNRSVEDGCSGQEHRASCGEAKPGLFAFLLEFPQVSDHLDGLLNGISGRIGPSGEEIQALEPPELSELPRDRVCTIVFSAGSAGRG